VLIKYNVFLNVKFIIANIVNNLISVNIVKMVLNYKNKIQKILQTSVKLTAKYKIVVNVKLKKSVQNATKIIQF